jgi:type III secretory pathway lipoprotein EscJ
MRLKASDQRLSSERALEIVRRMQYHQVTLHRQQNASGLTSLSMEQRELFEAIDLPESAAKKL